MKKILVMLSALLITSILASQAVAQLTPAREQTLKFGLALYIREVSTEPAEIAPGSPAELEITLENVGDFFLKDVQLKLELPTQFAPLRAVSDKKIRRMEGREIVKVNFSIIAMPDAKLGVYKVPLVLDYLDEIGTRHIENNTISLEISDTPKIFAEIDNSDIYGGNKIGKVVISIVNNGVADIKFLTAELQESEDYEILTSKRVYVGELDSDDYETVEFRLKVEDSKKMIDLPLRLEYSDTNNKDYRKDIDVALNIRSATEAGVSQSNTGLIISIIVGLVVIYFVYRSIRKRASRRAH